MRGIVRAAWLALYAVGCSTPQEQKRPHAGGEATSSAAVPSGAGANRGGQSSPPRAPAAEPAGTYLAEDPVLARLRGLLEEARNAQEAKDFAGARRRIAEAIEKALAETAEREDRPTCVLLEEMGRFAHDAGELHGAEKVRRRVVEVFSRTLPDDHPDLQKVRNNLAMTIRALGDLHGARALFEKVLEVRSRTLPDDHPDLQRARGSLGVTIQALGDPAGARALFEKVLEVNSRTLPDDHPDLQAARGNLAVSFYVFGDLASARALFEKILEVFSRTLPDDHPDLQRARGNLALTIKALGDLYGARALEEKVLEVRSGTLPGDHPDLQAARNNLAATIKELGDLAGARALFEKVLEVNSRTLPDDHPDLQAARGNLAVTINSLGDLAGARALEEKVLEVRSRTLPDDHPDLQAARLNLAATIGGLFARAAVGSGGEGGSGGEREEGRERCTELVLALCRAQTRGAQAALLESSAREAQARCEALAARLDNSLSFAAGCGVFEPIAVLDRASFELSETTRGAALGAAALMRQASGAPEYPKLREALREQSDVLASLVQKGSSSVEFQEALERRDSLQRDLAKLARQLPGGAPAGLDFDVEALAGRLSENEAVVGFRRYVNWKFENVTDEDHAGSAAPLEKSVASFCALVLRRGSDESPRETPPGTLTRVDLGPIAPIEEAVRAWREGLGVGADSRGVSVNSAARVGGAPEDVIARGRALRRMVFDPLLPALQEADHVRVALDDVLHLVPLEALPTDEGAAGRGEHPLLGERWRIETRATLAELLAPVRQMAAVGELVAVGGVAYGAAQPVALARPTSDSSQSGSAAVPGSSTPPSNASALTSDSNVSEPSELGVGADPGTATGSRTIPGAATRRNEEAGILRGGAWSGGFSELPATAVEIETIAREFGERHPAAAVTLLEGGDATRERLLELVPQARWLHIATHGWFASESIRSWKDPQPIDTLSGLGQRLSGEEQVKGMSPMLLCGLALAGANLPENELGRVPGLVTAEELAALDLSHCELAVLSACDTNVGERRAGQGVASLQMALQMAGARSVITSLWKVPDEATRELMTDFYRRVWVEGKPKHLSLWEAKMRLCDAKDGRGQPKYTLRDWAAWVLTGEPD